MSIKWILALFSLAISCLCNAQVTQEQLDAIAKASQSEVNRVMRASAEMAAKNTPFPVDSLTTVVGAVYFKETMTLTYYSRIPIDLSDQEKTAYIEEYNQSFCKSAMNKAFLQKGVKYNYIYEMPTKKMSFTFDQKSCD